MKNLLLSITFCFLPLALFSQDINSRTLLTVNGRKTEAGEFIRMFNKNAEPGKQPDPDAYLKQFIIFKLKVADAIKLGFDTTRSFRNEFKGYRNQLAGNYLIDTRIKETLLKSAYQRSLTDVKAWHILVAVSPDASAADTLRAWKKASGIRERILTGESFENVARSTSDDKSVLLNGGNLGYFNIFQMIMPFEEAAYKLKKGEISQPVRTSYGYHIIKVTDRKPSPGRIKVAHIMKAVPPGADEAEALKAEVEIKDLYNKLKNGESFASLAQKYSDHKESAANGGVMEWFGTGDIISSFTEAAFAIKDTGMYSKPVRTPYGWHIIKLLGKQPPRSYEDSKSYIESRFNQSYLNSLARNSLVTRLKIEYKFRLNEAALNWFILNTDTLVIQGLKKYDRTSMPASEIYSFANQKLSCQSFASYIEKRGYMILTKDSSEFIKKTINLKVTDHILKYEDSVLEKKYPEFRYLVNEFHDGILLFEISGRKVWNRVNEDTAGLRKYYNDHKMNYLSAPGIEGKLYTLKMKGGEKKLSSQYEKLSSRKDADERLVKKFNRKGDTILLIKTVKLMSGDNAVIDKIKWEKGVQYLDIDGMPALLNISNLIPAKPLEMEEIRSELISGYQEYLEKEWIKQLENKYIVKVDNAVMAEVRKKLKL